MATNFVQPGHVLELEAPTGGVVSGTGYLIGSLFVVALTTVAQTLRFSGQIDGVWTLPKVSAQAWTEGQKIYWDDGNDRTTTVATDGVLIGVASVAADNPSSTGDVRLNGAVSELAEGPQATIAALTDSTGVSGSHDDTLADGLTATAPAAVTAVVLDDETGASADAEGDLAAAAAGACAGSAEPSATQVDTAIATAVAPLDINTATMAVAINALVADVTELQARLDEAVTDITVQNQNDSDLAQKILEIRTALIAAGVIASA
jgi:predicted RecA/RadA family phage recombinase